MNDQAQQVLADMMQRALDGVDAAVDFSQAQIPDVVEQLLMWHMVESLVFFSLGLFGVLSTALFWWKMLPKVIKEHQKDYSDQREVLTFGIPIIGTAVSALVVIFSLATTLSSLEWLKIWMAPKLYLLEYAASLVK